MRKVPLEQLTSDMRLGRTVFRGMNILINAGTAELTRYVSRLTSMGITHLYIEDEACEGIDFDDPVAEQTRLQCKKTLEQSFKRLKSRLSVDVGRLSDVVDAVMDDVLYRPRMLVSLSQINGIGDNTLDHSVNTTIYAICLARQLGFRRAQIKDLAQGTLLHDIGKTRLDSRILFKPGPLGPDEFKHIKEHPRLGYDILSGDRRIPEACRQICLYHHERTDGSGYPDGLVGNAIPEYARLTAVVDVYEALTVDRCYHKAVPPLRAVEVLSQEVSRGLDLQFTSVFIQNVAIYPNGTMVCLSDGRFAVVKEQNQSLPSRPVVRMVTMENGRCIPGGEIDLGTTLNITITDSDVLLPEQ